MRPSTLAEACRRAQAGEDFELAIGDFLQPGCLAEVTELRVPVLTEVLLRARQALIRTTSY